MLAAAFYRDNRSLLSYQRLGWALGSCGSGVCFTAGCRYESASNAMRKADIKQIDRIAKEEDLSRGQRRMLHDEVEGQGSTLEEIREIAKEIKRNHPNK